jgi:predicted NUDIX family phosphoesterase
MKSALQQRAEAAAERFRTARKPVVIEFAGVPKAGKTTTLGQVHAFLKRCGFRVEVVVEHASICPIRDKKHANFNVWTACTTLSQILEKTQIPSRPGDPDVLILDRGLFDAVNWFAVMERLARIRKAERELIEKFLLLDDWRKRISGVILMTASPTDSMDRERGYLPVDDATGSIMNEDVLRTMLETTRETAARLGGRNQFRVFEVDTSQGVSAGPQTTAEQVADLVLQLIEEQLEEEILFLPADTVAPLFKTGTWIDKTAAEQLVELFTTKGVFRGRETVESDSGLVQALPVVVVRNRRGDLLRLKRREQRKDNPLHGKIVIWAGGHVRREDGANGPSIGHGAVRELQEELRLSVEPGELEMLGAVWIRGRDGDRTRRHVAIVHEWRARTDDVAVALSATEFFERRGTSLSGSFVSPHRLATDVDDGRICEPWSVEIARYLLPEGDLVEPRLV